MHWGAVDGDVGAADIAGVTLLREATAATVIISTLLQPLGLGGYGGVAAWSGRSPRG